MSDEQQPSDDGEEAPNDDANADKGSSFAQDPASEGEAIPGDDASAEDADQLSASTESGAAVALNTSIANAFQNLDVGKINSKIDFSAFAPKIPESLQRALANSLAKINFGSQPVIDAALAKSLDNMITTQSIFPPGYFDQLTNLKFPELRLHPDTIDAIEAMAIPARVPLTTGKEMEAVEDVVLAELVEDDEPGTVVVQPTASVAEQNLALNQRMVELLEQSLEQTAEANAEAATEREKSRKSGNLNIFFAVAGLVIGIGGIVVGVLISG